jgi:Tfp pilus assembly protein PilF
MPRLFALFVVLFALPALAGDGAKEFIAGLDFLETGKFSDAADQFKSAIEENDENPDYRIGLGVALTLGEKLPEAEKVLARAIKLSNNSDESRLWMATVVAMQGQFMRDTEYYPAAVFKNEYVNEIREMSRQYGQAAFALETAKRNGNNKWDMDYAKQELAKRDALRKDFPRYGTAFSQKMKSKLGVASNPSREGGADQQKLSDALLSRIKANVDKGDYEAALRDINPLLMGNANDPQLIVYHGLCKLHLGAPEIARKQLTRALYTWPLDAELYALRAVAAARTGDARRAKLDLAIAKSSNSKRIDWAEKEVAAAPRAKGDPEARLYEMFDAAKAGTPYPSLVDSATKLLLAENSRRLRIDEAYIDQLREHQLAVNEQPKNAERLAAFAAFLYDNAVNPRGEAVELRADWKPYRPVNDSMVQAELTRALNIANESLAVDPANVSAMITKAAVLVNRMQLGDAEQFLKDALNRAPTEPRLLRLFAEVADRAAAAKASQASSLRTPTTWEDQFYIYTRYPSAAERAQADALEAQANRLWEMARGALEQAIAQAKDHGEASYFSAVLARRDRDYNSAITEAKAAVEFAPNNLEYLDMLSSLLAVTGQRAESLLNQARAANLVHSTAGPVLKCVWLSLPRTKFKTSREYLAQAAKYDPGDPRIAAYFGAVAGADDKTEEAAAWYSVACALYEASARFEGVSASSKEPSPLRTDVAVTMMNVNLRAIHLLKASHPQDAIKLCEANLAMQPRLDRSVLFTPIPASMLPDVDADQIPVPQADHAGYLLSITRLELGRTLLAQGQLEEAMTQLEQVKSYRDMVPPTVDAGSRMYEPVTSAGIYRISVLLAMGDKAKATEQFRYVGRPPKSDPETVAEYQRISAIIQGQREEAQAQEDEDALRQQQEALERARQERQRQIDEAQRRRRQGRS